MNTNTDNPSSEEVIYKCIEKLITSDGSKYYIDDKISEDVYIYLQPSEREHFQNLDD